MPKSSHVILAALHLDVPYNKVGGLSRCAYSILRTIFPMHSSVHLMQTSSFMDDGRHLYDRFVFRLEHCIKLLSEETLNIIGKFGQITCRDIGALLK